MHHPRQLREFTDGTSHTIVASEQIAGRDDLRDDDGKQDFRGTWAHPYVGPLYLHYHTPNSSAPDETLSVYCVSFSQAPCISIGSGHEAMRRSVMAARSFHPGGVNVVFADGHVDFYADEVDLHLWRALSTIAGGEVIPKHDH